jgi:hypothetical protein
MRTKEKARRGNDSKRRKKIHSPLFPSLIESVCLPGSSDGHHGHMARMPCHTRQEGNKPSSHKSSQCVKKGGKLLPHLENHAVCGQISRCRQVRWSTYALWPAKVRSIGYSEMALEHTHDIILDVSSASYVLITSNRSR